MYDALAWVLIGIIGFGGLISLAVFTKMEKTYGSKRAIRYTVISSISILSILLFGVFLLNKCSSPCPNCGCDNVEDCISKHKFEEARKYASNYSQSDKVNDEKKVKIIPVEAMFWIEQKELKRAETLANELQLLGQQYDNSDYHPLLTATNLNKIYVDITISIVNKYCETGQVDQAVSLMKRMPQKILIEDHPKPGVYSYPQERAKEIIKQYK